MKSRKKEQGRRLANSFCGGSAEEQADLALTRERREDHKRSEKKIKLPREEAKLR